MTLYANKGHFLKNLRRFPAVIFKMAAGKKISYHLLEITQSTHELFLSAITLTKTVENN